MFWDRVSGFYDLFGKIYNGKVNREMCRTVAKEIKAEDRVLECACRTGLITAAVAGKCGKLVATDYSEGMLKQTRKKAGRRYLNKYRLICDVNGDLLVDTVELARRKSLQEVGLAMHVQEKAAGCHVLTGKLSGKICPAVRFRILISSSIRRNMLRLMKTVKMIPF